MVGVIFGHLIGQSLQDFEHEMLLHPLVAGITLFERNYADPFQLSDLIQSIKAINPDMIISVDHEGGRVQRFRQGFTQIPSMHALASVVESLPENQHKLLSAVGWLLATELIELGIDLNFGPVLDLDYSLSGIIGERSFGESPEKVATMAKSLIAGMKSAGMQPVGKHFPGHGCVHEDSHLTLPRDDRGLEVLKKSDMAPYVKLGGELSAIMTAHILYSNIDSDMVTYSKFWLNDVMRHDLGFKGVIISDDLMMGGAQIEPDVVERVRRTWQAGADVALWCNGTDEFRKVLKSLESEEPDYTVKQRVQQLKAKSQFEPSSHQVSQAKYRKEHAQLLVELLHGELAEQARISELAEHF